MGAFCHAEMTNNSRRLLLAVAVYHFAFNERSFEVHDEAET